MLLLSPSLSSSLCLLSSHVECDRRVSCTFRRRASLQCLLWLAVVVRGDATLITSPPPPHHRLPAGRRGCCCCCCCCCWLMEGDNLFWPGAWGCLLPPHLPASLCLGGSRAQIDFLGRGGHRHSSSRPLPATPPPRPLRRECCRVVPACVCRGVFPSPAFVLCRDAPRPSGPQGEEFV